MQSEKTDTAKHTSGFKTGCRCRQWQQGLSQQRLPGLTVRNYSVQYVTEPRRVFLRRRSLSLHLLLCTSLSLPLWPRPSPHHEGVRHSETNEAEAGKDSQSADMRSPDRRRIEPSVLLERKTTSNKWIGLPCETFRDMTNHLYKQTNHSANVEVSHMSRSMSTGVPAAATRGLTLACKVTLHICKS